MNRLSKWVVRPVEAVSQTRDCPYLTCLFALTVGGRWTGQTIAGEGRPKETP